jgi:hypothetical protein
MLNTVGRFIYTKYWEILYVEYWEDLFTQNTGKYFMLNTGKIYLHKILGNTFMLNNVGIFIDTTYWEILYVEQCGNIYLHKIL